MPNFSEDSVDVKIYDVDGLHYQWTMKKLEDSILPFECFVIIKSRRVMIHLEKKKKRCWVQLDHKDVQQQMFQEKREDSMAEDTVTITEEEFEFEDDLGEDEDIIEDDIPLEYHLPLEFYLKRPIIMDELNSEVLSKNVDDV
ncbi:hypothetical protein R1sor_012227 [Riccia sorocarpa]|uniref:Uncharacterized protein n=1 Tax=Riccia sorocarpa TaxID=122646 RepID=A0ABD3I407_9MARC